MSYPLEPYRVFYQVALEESFTKAAGKLFVTQSSVSQSVKSLEDHLKVKLFFRRGRGIALTEEGILLYAHLKVAFNEFDKVHRYLEKHQNLESGQLRIGASDTLCKHYFLEVFEEFHTRYPGIKLQINNQPSLKTMESLMEGSIDLGLINHEIREAHPQFDYTGFFPLEEVFFASEKILPSGKEHYTLKDLSRYPFVSLRENTSTRRFLEDFFHSKGLKMNTEVELISLDLIISLVTAGFGVGFADQRVIGNPKDKGLVILKGRFDLPRRHIAIITHRRLPKSPAARAFIAVAEGHKKKHSIMNA